MANTLKFGNGLWATKEGSTLAYNDENDNYKPLPFDFTRASNATVVNKAGLIETVGNGIPRIDFLDSEDGALLLEPQRSNLLPYSEDFSQTDWAKQTSGTASTPIITSNYAISPDGTLNADRVVFNLNGGTTSSDLSQIADSVISSIGDVTNSIWIKSNTSSNYDMSFINAFGSTISIAVTTEWKRFILTSTTIATTAVFKLRLRGNESTSDYADVSVWGAQLEAGSYATSYIPTSGSAVTRLAETCNNGANEQVINSTEGVLYVETKGFTDLLTQSNYIQLSKNGESLATNSLVIQHRNNGYLRIYVNGFDNADIHFNVNLDFTQNHKIAVLYKLNGYKLFIDGVSQSLFGTPTQTVFSGLDNLSFDLRGAQSWNGLIKDVKLYNTALTDEELAELTTI